MDPLLKKYWDLDGEKRSETMSNLFHGFLELFRIELISLYKFAYDKEEKGEDFSESEYNDLLGTKLPLLIKVITRRLNHNFSHKLLQLATDLGDPLDFNALDSMQLAVREPLTRIYHIAQLFFKELIEEPEEPKHLFGCVDNFQKPYTNDNSLFVFNETLWALSSGVSSRWVPSVMRYNILSMGQFGIQITPLCFPAQLDPKSHSAKIKIPKDPLIHIRIESRPAKMNADTKMKLTGHKSIIKSEFKDKDLFLSAYLNQFSEPMHLYVKKNGLVSVYKAEFITHADDPEEECKLTSAEEIEYKSRKELDIVHAKKKILDLLPSEWNTRNKMEELLSDLSKLTDPKKAFEGTQKTKEAKINKLRKEISDHTAKLKKISSEIKKNEELLETDSYVATRSIMDLRPGSKYLYKPYVYIDPIEEAWILAPFRKELSSAIKKQVSVYNQMLKIKKSPERPEPPLPLDFIFVRPTEEERSQIAKLLELAYAKCCQNALKGQVMQMIKQQTSQAIVEEIEDEISPTELRPENQAGSHKPTPFKLIDPSENQQYALAECDASLDLAIEKNIAELAEKLLEPNDSLNKQTKATGPETLTRPLESPFEDVHDVSTAQPQASYQYDDDDEWVQFAKEAEMAISQEREQSKQKKNKQKTKDKEIQADPEAAAKKAQLKALLDIKQELENAGRLKKSGQAVFRTVAEIMQQAKDIGLFREVTTTSKGSHVSFHITHSVKINDNQQDCGAIVTVPSNKKEFGKGLLKAIGNQVKHALRLMDLRACTKDDQLSICAVKELK